MSAVVKMYKGDTKRIRIALVDMQAEPIDLTGLTGDDIYATLRDSVTGTVRYVSYIGNGITVVGAATDGVIDWYIDAGESQDFPVKLDMVWDVQITLTNGDRFTVPRDDNGDPEIGVMSVYADATIF